MHASATATEPVTLDPQSIRRVILAASLGTLFEWYDFFLYGSLAVFFGGLFFPKGNDTAQLLASTYYGRNQTLVLEEGQQRQHQEAEADAGGG